MNNTRTTLTHAALPPWAAIRGDGRLRLLVPTGSPCCDCGADVHEILEYFMVTNQVWADAGMCRWGLLCIGCIEDRLGRMLVSADFTGAPCNRLDEYAPPGYKPLPIRRSARFTDRLAR